MGGEDRKFGEAERDPIREGLVCNGLRLYSLTNGKLLHLMVLSRRHYYVFISTTKIQQQERIRRKKTRKKKVYLLIHVFSQQIFI